MPFKNPHPLYSIWQGMRRRCYNTAYRQWADYGGRGIKICGEWNDFNQFVRDIGDRPSPKHSLDRIDNDGDYEPSNCRWATRREQQRNRRYSVWVEIQGERYRAIELAEQYGLKPDTITDRAAKGMTFAQVVAKTRYVFTGGWQKAVSTWVAKAKNRTHCKKGHTFTEENTYLTKEGWKRCRMCHRLKMQRLSAKKRAIASTT